MRTLIALLLTLILAGCSKQEEQEPEAHPVVAVKIAKVEQADLTLQVHAPATIYPREQAAIASKITAPIRTLLAKKGDAVAAGQLLAQLDDRDLLAQRTEALERARADAAGAQAALAQAQKNLDRRQKLFAEGAIPNRDLLATQTEFAQAKASAEAAQKLLDLLQNSGADGSDKGRTSFLNAQIQFAQIRSPFAGTITEQFQYPGDMAKPEAPIFTVMDLSTAVARAQVPASEMQSVARGQSCWFTGVDTHDARFAGHVSVVNQAVDAERRTVEVWCEIPNGNRALRGGAFGSLAIQTGSAAKSLVVPKSAVQFEEGSSKGYVLVVGADKKVKKQEVQTGGIFADRVRILAGLQAGDTIVTEGGYALPDGTAVSWGDEKKEKEDKP